MNTVMDDLSFTSGSDTIKFYNDESGPSSSQSVQLLEDKSQTLSQNEQQSSKSIELATKTNATILDGTFFKLISSDSKNVIASCIKCQPKNVIIKGSKFSSSNFKSHLKRKHDSTILDEYEKYINDKRKKEKIEYSNNTNRKNKTKYSQNKFDEDVTNYIIHSMAPLSTVDNPFFKQIFIASGVLKNNNLTLMSRRSLGRKIETRFNTSIQNLKSELEKVNYLCTTADVWSAKRRSFIGVTVHWINDDLLERKSASLACRRFKGAHTHDRIAKILHNIYYEYNLDVTKVNSIL